MRSRWGFERCRFSLIPQPLLPKRKWRRPLTQPSSSRRGERKITQGLQNPGSTMPSAPQTFKRKAKQQHDNRSTTERGYGWDWQQLREQHLKQHPLCAECESSGRTSVAEDVDHIKPFQSINDPLRLDPDNLRSLCRACHNRKTHGRIRVCPPSRVRRKWS